MWSVLTGSRLCNMNRCAFLDAYSEQGYPIASCVSGRRWYEKKAPYTLETLEHTEPTRMPVQQFAGPRPRIRVKLSCCSACAAIYVDAPSTSNVLSKTPTRDAQELRLKLGPAA